MGGTRKKKRWKPEEIVRILRRVLVEKAEVSKVCEETGCCPSQVYRRRKQLFDSGAIVFERSNGRPGNALKAAEAKAEKLEAKLNRKHEVLSELMEEHVALKKNLGEAREPPSCPTTRVMRSSTSSTAGRVIRRSPPSASEPGSA